MKDFINGIVELLFENIPFSKASEEAKSKITAALKKEYIKETEQSSSIEAIAAIINRYPHIQEAARLIDYDQKEIDALLNNDIILNKTSFKKIWKKTKRFIFIECLLLTLIISILLQWICDFRAVPILFAVPFITILSSFLFFIHKKHSQYAKTHDLKKIKLDASGRDFVKTQYDGYCKKEMNMVFVCIAFLFYILFTTLLSVFSSLYSFYDILQQISYNISFINICLYLLFKNAYCRHNIRSFFSEEKELNYSNHLKKLSIFSLGYWLIATTALFLGRYLTKTIINYFIAAALVYFLIILIYNLTTRKNLVFKNIVFNLRRTIMISLAISAIVLYQLMSMDLWLTQPYINTIASIPHEESKIDYNDENGVYTITTEKEDFKILQLTDIHLGGSFLSITKDIKALEAIYTLLKETKPDLVIVTGDLVFPMGVMSFSLNNRAPVMQFASFMRNTGIPWAFTYGNHDTEAMGLITDHEFDELLKSLSYRTSENLLYPYIQPDIYGRSNQMIEIRQTDGTLMQALFLLDSNDYMDSSKINDYDYIHDDQVDWYERQVLNLSDNEGYTIPSMLFFHIPLQEYREANDLLETGSSEVQYFYGKIGETMINKICSSEYPSKLFDTAVRLNSTKAMFCGHDHYNNQSIEYKGIRLTYGYSIDYLAMPGIQNDIEQRGATLITLHEMGDFTIEPYQLMDIS